MKTCPVYKGPIHFDYGPEYGPEFYGEKVTFSFIIQDLGGGQFNGKCIELDGLGMNPGIATISGYIDGNPYNSPRNIQKTSKWI